VFLTVRGGLERLVGRLRDSLDRYDVRTGVRASTIARGRVGFQVRTPEGVPMAADAVVVATPAFAAASLLRELWPVAASELDAIAYASVATVTLAYDRSALARPLKGTGFLVPRSEGRMVVGCTWMTSKWQHLASADHAIVRCAVGRSGDERWMSMPEDELIACVHGELAEAIGVREPPVETRVVPFERSMPQYVVGHGARLARIEAALAPGLYLAGAGYRGIGIPACIAQGRAAAARAVEFARERAPAR
jgi:oxygen-dependent protoporphyrinogen oxidase